MSLTIESVAAYLGDPSRDLLSDAPFRDWPVERSIDADLDEPVVDYVFIDNGMDFVCDQDESIQSIFLHADEERRFSEEVADLPLSSTRQQVIDKLGKPETSGSGMDDPVLGEFGPWDRFARSDYTLHVEYRVGINRISRLTFMRNDVVP